MNTIIIFRWILGIIFLIFSIYLIIVNYVMIFQSYTTKKFHSQIPLLGGISGLVALIIIPIKISWYIYLIPSIIDLGTIPLFFFTGIDYLFRRLKFNK